MHNILPGPVQSCRIRTELYSTFQAGCLREIRREQWGNRDKAGGLESVEWNTRMTLTP